MYWSSRADATLLLGDFGSALEDIRRAQVLPGQYPANAVQGISALAGLGRVEEATPVLSNSVASPVHAFTVLAYMAAKEGNAEAAIGFAEKAAQASADLGMNRHAANGVMSQVEVAALLGDKAGAVRFLHQAYQLGLPHGWYVFTRWDLRPLQGYQPFEDLMRPKG